MVAPGGIPDRESDRHEAEEVRARKLDAELGEVRLEMQQQLVPADLQRVVDQ